jgi:hypothetical protein
MSLFFPLETLIPGSLSFVHSLFYPALFCSQKQLVASLAFFTLPAIPYYFSPLHLFIIFEMFFSHLGVGGTIYNQYTITPLLNLGIPLHEVHQ